MPLEPNEPTPKPSRLIVPGSEPEPTEKPRIILPPGSSAETHDDLPEYPRLRPLQIAPVRDGERELIVISDPLGVLEKQPVLGMETVAILQLLDGTTSLTDIQALFIREAGNDLRAGNMVREFIAKLDELLLLQSPRFEAALEAKSAEWRPLEVRPATLDGVCYPAEHEPLEKYLDEQFEFVKRGMQERQEPAPAATQLPRAILSPHLDPRREGHVLARAYSEIGPDVGLPLRVVVFGTGHNLGDDVVALTRKRFDTPFGAVPCDTAFVDRVAAKLGPEAFKRELVHRDEHSIEFQLIYLQRRLQYRRFTLVPILCGGFLRLLDEERTPRSEPLVETLIAAVREAEAELGGPTLYVAGVDFSHVGPRFGDPPLDEEGAALLRATDERAINAAAEGDADAWFAAIAEGNDRTRICGFAPTYMMLRCAEPGTGRPLSYAASPEKDGSVVTVAAMVWP